MMCVASHAVLVIACPPLWLTNQYCSIIFLQLLRKPYHPEQVMYIYTLNWPYTDTQREENQRNIHIFFLGFRLSFK